ncbi:MAG TPA: 2-oxoacid:acceptor oxidoreductase subunit alpha [Casimicrobiaceae bacterium]|nr:2-oxoacid:acceptor oxidoreductase subunit alpha [Casimicrobiaceae bacterium]
MTAPTAPPSALRGVSIAIAGSGGAGVMTAGTLLLTAAAKAGAYGLMVRTSGPQIRGGEAAALVRLASHPVGSLDDGFDLLLALDWQNVQRFADEIPLGAASLVVGDASEGEAPATYLASGARHAALPLKAMAKKIPKSWTNMVALGVAGACAGLPREALVAALAESWKRDADALAANTAAIDAGFAAAAELPAIARLPSLAPSSGRWLVSGNEAAGLGAIRGGVRFVAAYPITPATELLEWMAPALAQVGGTLLQAEDELASINMIVGASFAGVPSLTATAGPGLALMTEGIGLAVSAEVPIVVVDVMRGGPSTGIPAKSEQSDLGYAVSGLHGDAPRVVVAPTSIVDCLATTQWAVHLAEAMQVPAIVLSDQFMGQSRAIVDRPDDLELVAGRVVAPAGTADYKRYRDTPSGVSPMALPGTPGLAYTADGLEKNEAGTPSSGARDHRVQLDKRERKVSGFDYGERWADVEGDGALAVITFGSSTAPVREAIARARASGVHAKLVALRLLAPVLPQAFERALDGVRHVIVVEQNHGAQLFRYLRGNVDLPGRPESFHRPGPLPLKPSELAAAITAAARRASPAPSAAAA